MLKSYGVVVLVVVVGWVAHEIFVSAQGPLVLGFWLWGFGVWCLGLTIKNHLILFTLKGTWGL